MSSTASDGRGEEEVEERFMGMKYDLRYFVAPPIVLAFTHGEVKKKKRRRMTPQNGPDDNDLPETRLPFY